METDLCFESASLVLIFHMACNDGLIVKITNICQLPPLCFRYNILTMERAPTSGVLVFLIVASSMTQRSLRVDLEVKVTITMVWKFFI